MSMAVQWAVLNILLCLGTPPIDPTKCSPESCVVMPTGCAKRLECQGCGSLCFNNRSNSSAFNRFLNLTGLSEQASAQEAFPDVPPSAGTTPPACPWPTTSSCFRGEGNFTLKKFSSVDPASKTTATCCSACVKTPGCKAWQMITRAGTTSPACWLMSTTDLKVDGPDTCTSGAPPGIPEREVRTADIVLLWSDIEPSPGNYNWSSLHVAARRAQAVGGQITVLLWTSQFAPHWLYNLSKVPILAYSKKSGSIVPDYTNDEYQRRLKSVHQSLASAINPIISSVMAVQPCVGSTGDDTPIHVTSGTGWDPEWSYINRTLLSEIGGSGSGSTSEWWSNFTRAFSKWLATNETAFAEPVSAGELVLLLNAQGTSFPLPWVASNLPGSFLKFGQSGHEYQSNYERFRVAEHAPYVYALQSGRPVRSRAELSSETCWTDGPFRNATACSVPWNVYAMTMWVASAHLDFWNVQPNAVTNILGEFRPLWRFLNRYAGIRWAWQTKGAWIGFRDGLDAMDIARFPEAYYGNIAMNVNTSDGYPELSCSKMDGTMNIDRACHICSSFKNRGCRIDTPHSLCGGPMDQRRARGMNDVAFGNWRDDYGAFLKQVAPEASVGWWRIGSESSLFGRFARGFADPTNSSAVISLKFDRGLWGGLPLSMISRVPLVVRLVFLDSGTGSFSIRYDGQHGPATLVTVSKKNSGEWRELCKPMTDARFDSTGPNGADIWLANEDEHDDIFDSLEVAIGEPDVLALNQCDWVLPDTEAPTTTE